MIIVQRIPEWQAFYSTLATASATLTGLLFVAMSLNANIRSDEDNAHLMRIARDTLGHFLVVLMTSLMFLVPRLPIPALVFSLCCVGVPWTIGAGWRFAAVCRGRKAKDDSYQLLRTTGLSILGGIGLTVVAIALLFEGEVALYLMVSVFTMLLAAAIGTAWFLLARLRI